MTIVVRSANDKTKGDSIGIYRCCDIALLARSSNRSLIDLRLILLFVTTRKVVQLILWQKLLIENRGHLAIPRARAKETRRGRRGGRRIYESGPRVPRVRRKSFG